MRPIPTLARSAGSRGNALWAILSTCLVLTACGSGSSPSGTSTAPEFVSTPGVTANQGITYTYEIQTAPPANSVTLAMSAAPSGAALNGNMLSWTPSAAQSRVSNPFSVTATNAAGSSTQSWSVSPAGTVTGTRVDTYWTSSGPVLVAYDWLKGLPIFPRALVPQPDGSFQEVQGSGNSDGTFSIPNIPAGYYWLQPGANMYWTSSSTFDFGSDIDSQVTENVLGSSSTTGFDFNVSGLDPLQTGDEIQFIQQMFLPFSIPFVVGSPSGATTSNLGARVTSNFDFSQPNPAFLLQYEPETFGGFNALRLGPAETFPGLALVNGVSNTVNAALVPSPQDSFDLNIKGSAWTPLFTNVSPNPATVEGAALEVMTQPFVTGSNLLAAFGQNIPLLVDLSPPPFELPIAPSVPVCNPRAVPIAPGVSIIPPGEPPVTADQDFGTVAYGDPFPSSWPRIFTFCQIASVPIPLPGSSAPAQFLITASQSSSLPASPISPPFGPVQNPTINGQSLFVPGTIALTGVTLNWTAPSGATPTGYAISTFATATLPSGVQTYFPRLSYFTAKTSASLPPLPAGQPYVFVITAISDGAASFETRPLRSALPTASVSAISAPMTVSGGN